MSDANIHSARRLEILRAHPDLSRLFGASPWTLLVAAGFVAFQFLLAWGVKDQPWWVAVLLAVFVGAFVIHGLNCVIHECTHNLVFRGSAANKALAIFATLPALVPAASGFRHYHLLHHREFGIRGLDADVAPQWEIDMVGRSWWRKLIWLLILPLGYTVLRPFFSVRERMPVDRWFIANILLIAC